MYWFKCGFGVLVSEWFKGDLCGWVDELFDLVWLVVEGVFDVVVVVLWW